MIPITRVTNPVADRVVNDPWTDVDGRVVVVLIVRRRRQELLTTSPGSRGPPSSRVPSPLPVTPRPVGSMGGREGSRSRGVWGPTVSRAPRGTGVTVSLGSRPVVPPGPREWGRTTPRVLVDDRIPPVVSSHDSLVRCLTYCEPGTPTVRWRGGVGRVGPIPRNILDPGDWSGEGRGVVVTKRPFALISTDVCPCRHPKSLSCPGLGRRTRRVRIALWGVSGDDGGRVEKIRRD